MKNICFCPKCMNTFETPGIVGERIYNCSNDDAYPGDPVCPVCGSADYFEGDDAVAEMAAIIESYVKTRITEHWTDAKKYAPKTGERVLCVNITEDGKKEIIVDYAVGGMWHGKNVVAWMKLPVELPEP